MENIMKELLSAHISKPFLKTAGTFVFKVTNVELTKSKKLNDMFQIEVESENEKATLYFSLNYKAKWKLADFIVKCLKLTKDQIATFEIDFEADTANLITNKEFKAEVVESEYVKHVSEQDEAGLFVDKEVLMKKYEINETWSV